MTRREAREARLAEELQLALQQDPAARPSESRRARRLRERPETPEVAAADERAEAPADVPVAVLPSASTPRLRPRKASRVAAVTADDPAPEQAAPAPVALPEVELSPVSSIGPEPSIVPEPAIEIELEAVPKSAIDLELAIVPEPAIAPEPDILPELTIAPDPQRFRFDVGSIPLVPLTPTPLTSREASDDASEPVLPAVAGPVGAGRILRRALSVGLAAAGVAGLVLTAAIPSLAPLAAEGAVQAAAIQQLSVGGSTDSTLRADFVEGIDGVEVAADAALVTADTFVNNPFGIVQYPFSQGVPLTDPYGYRTEPIAQLHDGQDFAAGNGAAVRSIADGTVLESGPTTDGCGTGMKLSHLVNGLAIASRYCHMQEGSTQLEVGDTVSAGQMLGRVGATGMSFGPHLHLVIEVAGTPIDPMPFLKKYNAITK